MNSRNEGNTLLMREEEAARIRATVRDRLEKCAELEGHPREPRDSTEAISQATGVALMADMGKMTGTKETVPVLAVGQPYPPCLTASWRDLEPMKIADLRMHTHHRGRRIMVKRVSPVVPLVARSWTMVQDLDGGETERLEVCLHASRHGEDVLNLASVFVIREPFFTLTDQGDEAIIRIDHPSDLVVCGDTNDTINGENGRPCSDSERAERAKMCKEEGNSALAKEKLSVAYAKYTEGIKLAEPDSDLVRDIYRNRAHVNLLLDRLDEAQTDAKESLSGRKDLRSKDLDSKAYFRAGYAAYNLGEYQQAQEYFERERKLALDEKYASVYLRKIEARLREQERGLYDFKKMRASLSQTRPRVDAASFVANTKVGDSPGRGRGLFATRSIAPGEIIMCEKAFCVVWGHEKEALTAMTYDARDDRIRASPVGLTRSIVQKLLNNPSQAAKVMDLYSDDYSHPQRHNSKDSEKIGETQGTIVIDVHRVHDIVSRNAFGPGSPHGQQENAQNASTGLWIHASYMNHSCLPNAQKDYIGDLITVKALQPITPGAEITHSYTDESADWDARRSALTTTWGFACDCALCAAEEADGADVRRTRRRLGAEAEAFLETVGWAVARRVDVLRVRMLVRSLEDTYERGRYEGLPRVAARGVREWLEKAGSGKYNRRA